MMELACGAGEYIIIIVYMSPAELLSRALEITRQMDEAPSYSREGLIFQFHLHLFFFYL